MPEAEREGEHEYELIPISPIRKLEKRLTQLESGSGLDTREFYREMADIIRMNQQLVDELAKANDALRIELSKLPSKLDELVSRMDELISFIKASAAEDVATAQQAGIQPLSDKFDQLIDVTKKVYESNQSVVSAIDELDKKMKKPMPPPMRRPLFPSRPI